MTQCEIESVQYLWDEQTWWDIYDTIRYDTDKTEWCSRSLVNRHSDKQTDEQHSEPNKQNNKYNDNIVNWTNDGQLPKMAVSFSFSHYHGNNQANPNPNSKRI